MVWGKLIIAFWKMDVPAQVVYQARNQILHSGYPTDQV